MKKVCLLLGGSALSMRYRIKRSFDQIPCPNTSNEIFVTTGLISELDVFSKLGKFIFAEVLSWDTLTNINQTENFWKDADQIIITTGKWHGKRVRRLFSLINPKVKSVIFIDSGEPEHWSAIPLYCMYYFLWSAKIMAFVAKKLRTGDVFYSKCPLLLRGYFF